MIINVAPKHGLHYPAALAYLRALAAGCPPGITSARRSHALQRELFHERYVPEDDPMERGPYGDVRFYKDVRYVRVSSKGSVAVPGSQWSRHETGLSLDLPSGGPREWMRANGHKFGFIKDLVPGEPWHFEYNETRDESKGKEIDVLIIRRGSKAKGYKYRLVTGTYTVAQSRKAVVSLKKAGIKVSHLPDADYMKIYNTLKK